MEEVLKFIESYKCKDVALFDLSAEKRSASFMIVVTVKDVIENKKFADAFMKEFSLDELPEGYYKGEWIIIKHSDILLHSFIPVLREKYNLDKLWQNNRVNIAKHSKSKK